MEHHQVLGRYVNKSQYKLVDFRFRNSLSLSCEPNVSLYSQLKQDKENYRVLYREGPHGSPFHTLLAEGYANASVDTCKPMSSIWQLIIYT